jgi:hypothetical protein
MGKAICSKISRYLLRIGRISFALGTARLPPGRKSFCGCISRSPSSETRRILFDGPEEVKILYPVLGFWNNSILT